MSKTKPVSMAEYLKSSIVIKDAAFGQKRFCKWCSGMSAALFAKEE